MCLTLGIFLLKCCAGKADYLKDFTKVWIECHGSVPFVKIRLLKIGAFSDWLVDKGETSL